MLPGQISAARGGRKGRNYKVKKLPPGVIGDILQDRACSACDLSRPGGCVQNPNDPCSGLQAGNFECPGCHLWREIANCLTESKPPPLHCDSSFYYAAPTKAWLIEPTAPGFIGIENVLGTNTAIDGLWERAWEDAIKGSTPGKRTQIAAAELTIVLNAVGSRSQHSLHLHVGSRTPVPKTCTETVLAKTTQGDWKSSVCKNLSANQGQDTTVYYTLVDAANRPKVNSFLSEGLKIAGKDVTKDKYVGTALVDAPPQAKATSGDNYLLIYDGNGVSDYTLISTQ